MHRPANVWKTKGESTVLRDSPPRRRSSLRLRGFDYAQPDAYFIIVCTRGRTHRLGTVVDGTMHLSSEGEIVAEVCLRLPLHYPNVELDGFAGMPNHVYGIIVAHAGVGAGFKPAHAHCSRGPDDCPAGRNSSLSDVVRGLKTFSARGIHALHGTPGLPVWQRGYYDHIIRGEKDLDRVRQYIEVNPLRWLQDEENPQRHIP